MTLAKVAQRAGVSTATVSRVLNNQGIVKDSTRKRVLSVVETLNYYPNLHARSLAGGKNNTIGLIVSNLSNPFFVDVFQAMDATARAHGYDVLVEQTDYKVNQLRAGVRSLLGKRVVGLAIIVSEMEEGLLAEIQASERPTLFYDVGAPAENSTNIRVRYELGTQRAVQYLYSLGHRRMAFVGHHSALNPLQVRREAFLGAVAGYDGAVSWKIALGPDSPAGGAQAVGELLLSGFRPTAIVCVNDYMAIGVLSQLRVHNYSVPADISVTGFDNISLSQFTNPPLTTLNIPREAIGQMAARALLPDWAGMPIPPEVLLEPEFVLRESTGPALVS
ncbi:MAG TPA: LacI family DNA-binding transcriptional regulator [Terriglobia bacterium]